MGNAGGDIDCRKQVLAAAPVLSGDIHVNVCVFAVTGSEEWQSMHVVPVKVTEQIAPSYGLAFSTALRPRSPVPASSATVGRECAR